MHPHEQLTGGRFECLGRRPFERVSPAEAGQHQRAHSLRGASQGALPGVYLWCFLLILM